MFFGDTRLPEAFWKNVTVDPETGCWIWSGFIGWSGYARWKKNPGHRVTYEIVNGPVPKGLHCDHLCRVRSCVNPTHIEVVTCKENVLRGVGAPAMNARKTHCIHGHEFSPENTKVQPWGRECITCNRARWLKWWRKKKGKE